MTKHKMKSYYSMRRLITIYEMEILIRKKRKAELKSK